MSVKSWRYAIFEGAVQAMEKLGRKDLVVTGLGANPQGIAAGTIASQGQPTIDLAKLFGPKSNDAFYSSIAEVWFNAAAIGSALVGCRAINWHGMGMANTYMFELITQHAAKFYTMTGGQATVPAVFEISVSGPSYGRGAQHNDYEADSWYMHATGLKTIAPATVYDAKGLMASAIKCGDPVAFIDRTVESSADIPDEYYEVPIGKAAIRTEGNDITIVGNGSSMPVVNTAVKTLQDAGISVESIDLRTLAPLDTETLVKSVQKTGRLLTVDWSHYTLCPGTEVIARCAEGVPGAKFRRMAMPDCAPGAAKEFVDWIYPKAEEVVKAAQMLLVDTSTLGGEK